MAKTKTQTPPPKQKPGTQVAKTGGAGLPATAVADAAAKYAGAGISDRMEDNIVPLVYLLQANSKPALKGHEKYVKGAVGGSIWLRNDPPEDCLIDGEEGMVFQPCHLSVCWIEWQPERAGFAARHDARPEDAVLKDEENDSGSIVKVWRRPNGNSVNESREYAGFVHREGHEPAPYTIPLSGSGHTVGKQWMTSMRAEKLPNGERAPLFFNLYRLTTKLRTKGENSWYQYEITKEGPVQTIEDIERGAALFEAFEAGTKKSASAEDLDDADTGAGTGTGGEIDDSED